MSFSLAAVTFIAFGAGLSDDRYDKVAAVPWSEVVAGCKAIERLEEAKATPKHVLPKGTIKSWLMSYGVSDGCGLNLAELDKPWDDDEIDLSGVLAGLAACASVAPSAASGTPDDGASLTKARSTSLMRARAAQAEKAIRALESNMAANRDRKKAEDALALGRCDPDDSASNDGSFGKLQKLCSGTAGIEVDEGVQQCARTLQRRSPGAGTRGFELALPSADLIIQGVTAFLAKRTRAEIELFGLERLDLLLCGEEKDQAPTGRDGLDIKTLLPQACASIGDLRKRGVAGEAAGSTLVAAIRRDIADLPANLVDLGAVKKNLAAVVLFEVAGVITANASLSLLADRTAQAACEKYGDQATYYQAAAALLRSFAEAGGSGPIGRGPANGIFKSVQKEFGFEPTTKPDADVMPLLAQLQEITTLRTNLGDSGLAAEARTDLLRRLARSFVLATGYSVSLFSGNPMPFDTGVIVAFEDFLSAWSHADAQGTVASVTSILRQTGVTTNDGADTITPWLNAVAAIAAAQSPEDVAVALESIVAPAGLWRTKRGQDTISVTALVGLFAGLEATGDAGLDKGIRTDLTGAQAAVGIDFSRGEGFEHVTWGLFVPIIDLGGYMSGPVGPRVFQRRLPNGDNARIEVAHETRPLSVLAPGLYFRLGLGNSPFVFALGGNVVPYGRRLKSADSDAFDEGVAVFRGAVLLATDLTLFSF